MAEVLNISVADSCYTVAQESPTSPLSDYGHKVYDTVTEGRVSNNKTGVEIHIVSHTHWDREWYRPLEEFGRLLVSTMDNVVDALTNPAAHFSHFHMDSQSVLVEDYLAARPDLQKLVVSLINNNQIGTGPWYTQPDEFLVSGESLIRNLLYGIMALEDLHANYSRVGYIPDQFGHTAQMPQIFAGFGLYAAATMRGTPPGTPLNTMWQSPDGTRILMLRFSNYCGMFFNEPGKPALLTQVQNEAQRWVSEGKPWDGVSTLYFMNGCDHRDIDTAVGSAVETAKAMVSSATAAGITLFDKQTRTKVLLPVRQVFHSNLEDVARLVLNDVKRDSLKLETLSGEIRHGVDHLADVTSSGMSLKRRNWAAQELLENWAEPLNVAAMLAGAKDEGASLRRAWKFVLENHFHDTLCTTSAPQVLRDSRGRAERAIAIAETVSSQHMTYLMKSALPIGMENVFVFNPTNVERRGELVVVWLQIPLTGPFAVAPRGTQVAFEDVKTGGIVPGVVLDSTSWVWNYRHRAGLFRQGFSSGLMKIAFRPSASPNEMRLFQFKGTVSNKRDDKKAPSILAPGGARRSVAAAIAEAASSPPVDSKKTGAPAGQQFSYLEGTQLAVARQGSQGLRMENEHLVVEVAEGGTGSVTISGTKIPTYPNINQVRVVGDSGSQYLAQYGAAIAAPWKVDKVINSTEFQLIQLSATTPGPDSVSLAMQYVLPTESRILWVRVRVENPGHVRDFAVRAVHPLPFQPISQWADMAFHHIQRNRGEAAPMTKPHHRWCAVQANSTCAFGVAGRGLYESRSVNSALEMTLMRAVNKIQDWALFKNEGAQDFGVHHFEYAIVPAETQNDPISQIDLEARQFASPLCPVQHIDWGMLPSQPLTCVSESSFTRLAVPGFGRFDVSGNAGENVREPRQSAVSKSEMENAASRLLVCTVEPSSLVLSSVKRAERVKGFIVRIYNPRGNTVVGTLKFALPMESVRFVNMNEKPSERPEEQTPPTISAGGRVISNLTVSGGRIITLLLQAAKK